MANAKAQLHAVGAPASAKSRGRRTYDEAFKRDAVEKARAAKSISQVATALGVSRPTLRAWMNAAAPPPMTLIEAARSGNRKAYLEALRDQLAEKIAAGMTPRDLPPNVRLLNETMQQLEDLAAREREDSDAESVPDEDLEPDEL